MIDLSFYSLRLLYTTTPHTLSRSSRPFANQPLVPIMTLTDNHHDYLQPRTIRFAHTSIPSPAPSPHIIVSHSGSLAASLLRNSILLSRSHYHATVCTLALCFSICILASIIEELVLKSRKIICIASTNSNLQLKRNLFFNAQQRKPLHDPDRQTPIYFAVKRVR